MRTAITIVSALLLSVSLATPGWSKSAREYCPDTITATCLNQIAENMIENLPEDDDLRSRVAVDYATQITAEQPEKAITLVREYATRFDETGLRVLAEQMAEDGQDEIAREVFRIARQVRVDDPDPTTKVLDLLYIGGMMAAAGYLDLTKETHIIATEFLPGEIEDVVLSEELRLARLMGLYGWPEESDPWFTAAYDRISEIPAGTYQRGFALTDFMSVATIIGNTALTERTQRDLARFYETARPDVQDQVRISEIRALAESGRVEEAASRARAHGKTLDTVLTGTPSLFLNNELDYAPDYFPDTEARFEKMIAALETEEAKGRFITALAQRLIQDELFEKLEGLLARVTTPAERSGMVLELMIYYSREKNDPAHAADLFFSEEVDFNPAFASQGTFLRRYPLSLTATGLWETGDHERARILTRLVLDLWTIDNPGDRHDEIGLILELARAGQDQWITEWLDAASTPMERITIRTWAARGKSEAGDFMAAQKYLSEVESSLADLSDEAGQRSEYWPEDLPIPTERGEAADLLENTRLDMIAEMARQDQLDLARAALDDFSIDLTQNLRVMHEIIKAEARAGNAETAEAMRYDMLEGLLSGKIDARNISFVVPTLQDDLVPAD